MIVFCRQEGKPNWFEQLLGKKTALLQKQAEQSKTAQRVFEAASVGRFGAQVSAISFDAKGMTGFTDWQHQEQQTETIANKEEKGGMQKHDASRNWRQKRRVLFNNKVEVVKNCFTLRLVFLSVFKSF